MSFYVFNVSVPPNTAETRPVVVNAKLNPGIIHRVSILFPPGPAALTHLQIRRGNHQVWPSNPDSDFASDDEVISWEDNYPLDDEPLILQLVAWNQDDTYPHTITVRFGLLPREQAPTSGILGQVLARLGGFIPGRNQVSNA